MAPIHSRKPKLHNPTSIHPQPTQLWIKGKPGQVARPGSVWVLEGEGMPIHGDPNAHGRLFVKFAVEFPPALALTCVGRILVFLVGGVWILVFVYMYMDTGVCTNPLCADPQPPVPNQLTRPPHKHKTKQAGGGGDPPEALAQGPHLHARARRGGCAGLEGRCLLLFVNLCVYVHM